MKKILLSLIILVIFMLDYTGVNAQSMDYFLRNKEYYGNFNNENTTKLNNAFDQKSLDNEDYLKYKKFDEKADFYKRMSTMPLSKSKIKKAQKKYDKYSDKAAKYRIEALNTFLSANSTIKAIYISKINTFKLSADSCLINELNQKMVKFLDSARIAQDRYFSDNIQQSLNLDEKYYYDNLAIVMLEYQLAVYNNDKDIITELRNYYCNQSSNANHTNVKPTSYSPMNDSLLFYTANPEIDLHIQYSSEEFISLANYLKLGQKGYLQMYKAQPIQDSVNIVTKKIAQTMDFIERSKLASQKKDLEKELYSIKIDGMMSYLQANKSYYDTRNNHIDDFSPKDSTLDYFVNYASFKEKAEFFYKDAEFIMQQSVNKGGLEKFNFIEKSNQQMITALQYQENAFNSILKYDTNFVLVRNEISLPDSIKNTITNNNQTTVASNNTNNNSNATNTNKNNNNNKQNNTTNNSNKNNNNNSNSNVAKVSGIYVYSYQNPDPKAAYTAQGTIYRVQVGTSKYLLPVNELKEYDQIYYETIAGSEQKRFLVGDYTNYDDAVTSLSELKKKGYKTAFIVKYTNGKRTDAIYSNTYTSSQTNNNTTTNTNNGKYVNAIDVSTTKYLTYLIQIGTFSSQKTSSDLKNLQKIYVRKLADGRYQYFVGPYYRYDEAESKLPGVKQTGFTDAIVVAFNNGQSVSIPNAKQIEKTAQINNQVIYRVQVGAFSDYLSTEQLDVNFGRLKDIYAINTHVNNGLIIYSVGNAKTLDEAKKLRQTVIDLGYSGSFVIAFKGNKQVPLTSVTN